MSIATKNQFNPIGANMKQISIDDFVYNNLGEIYVAIQIIDKGE
jgi:hypothetical protein